MVVKVGDLTVLTDPGGWTTKQNEVKGVDVVLITHEHPDHLHIESVKEILRNNPSAKIFTVSSVNKLLQKEGLKAEILSHGRSVTEKNILIEGFGKEHADIYPGIPKVENVGYFIANNFFYPGDAFTNPRKHVEILALPLGGPWMNIGQSIDYAKEIKPKIAIPVHDGMLGIRGPYDIHPKKFLGEAGIDFKVLKAGESIDL